VFIVISVHFIIDSVRELLDILSYTDTQLPWYSQVHITCHTGHCLNQTESVLRS